MKTRLLRLQHLLYQQTEEIQRAKEGLMELLSYISASSIRKLSKQEREEAAVIRIQLFWKNFLSSRSTGMVTPDLPTDSFFGSSPMIEMEGYYLFSFKIESITSGLKIGFSRSKNTLDSFDFISLDGTAHVSGEFTQISGGISPHTLDTLTLCVTKGTGQIQILLSRTGDCLQGPFPTDLPLLGPIWPVVQGAQIRPLSAPAAAPTVGLIAREEDALMTDGPLPHEDGLDFEVVEDPVAPVLFGFTNHFGAALWVKRLGVRPLWLVDFEAGEISFIPTRGNVSVLTWEPPKEGVVAGDLVSLKTQGGEVVIKLNRKIIARVNLGKEDSKSLYFLCEGIPSLQL